MAKFYYLDNGSVCGPESLQRIRGKIVLNFLPEDVQVCEEGREEWIQIQDVEEEPGDAANDEVYYFYAGESKGPIATDVLFQMVRKGYVPGNIKIRHSEDEQWEFFISQKEKAADASKESSAQDTNDVEEEPWEVFISQKIGQNTTLFGFLTFFGWANIVLGIIAMIVLLLVAKSTESWQTALYALFVLLGAIQPGIVMLALARILEPKLSQN